MSVISAGHPFSGRVFGVAVTFALALAMVLAQPASSLAWLFGEHTTIEQVALHDEAAERGNHHHHGERRHEGSSRADAHAEVPVGESASYPPFQTGLILGPAAPAGFSDDVLKGTLNATSPSLAPPGVDRHLVRYAAPPMRQHVPAVPHRPPITLR